MKVLILNGSPRLNGNTAAALKAIQKGILAKLPAAEIEFCDVVQMNIRGCIACNACKSNGGNCVMSDDTNQIIQKIADANLLILGSPVYYWGLTAQLKTVIDKFYCRNSALMAAGNKIIGLVTVGGATLDDPEYNLISGQIDCICNYLHWCHLFTKNISAYDLGEIAGNQALLDSLQLLGTTIV
ncbi:MAG TPA: flavodoxin family protein [Bacillota bacterium]|nr:flavodoxin family protein [Bacillota bacterium]